jgi:hypothetical protein
MLALAVLPLYLLATVLWLKRSALAKELVRKADKPDVRGFVTDLAM